MRDLRKSYGEVEAVRGVSFEVARGEVFCLLGPNGAGKTSIVEILEGYRKRSNGEVRVLGMDPARSERELHERVGIVLQECGVQNDLTVRELIEMYGRYHRRRRPIDEVIDLVELGEKRDTRARNLSGGQRHAPATELAAAIRRAVAGERVVDPGLAAAALSQGESPLTPREHEVILASRQHATVADLAGALYLSPGTVRNHLSSAMQKLDARNRAEAVRVAEEKGWL